MKRLQITEIKGFTLIDLSVSLLLGTIVISLGGTALSSIVTANHSASGKQKSQSEASQALEFIVTEARQAQLFVSDTATLNQLNNPGSPFQIEVNKFSPLTGATKEPVVVLDIGLSSSESIVYFLAPAITPWEGTALYRWGPPFNDEGNYELVDPTNPDSAIVPPLDKWVPSLLVDQVFEGLSSLNCNGWNPVPQTNARGFYACVDPEGRIAEFVFQSEAISNMELKAKAFARSHQP